MWVADARAGAQVIVWVVHAEASHPVFNPQVWPPVSCPFCPAVAMADVPTRTFKIRLCKLRDFRGNYWYLMCLSPKNLNMYMSYLNSDAVGHRTWPSVCITPRSQRHRCYGCGSWKCNLHPRICFVCRMKHAVPGATLCTVDGKSWAPVGREVSIPVVVNGRRNC